MTAFEQRLAAVAASAQLRLLAYQFAPFRQLEAELEEARWQRAAGAINDERFSSIARELDFRFERIVPFLERLRACVTRLEAVREQAALHLANGAKPATREAVRELDTWYTALAHGRGAAADPRLLVRFTELLRQAEDLLAPDGAARAPAPLRRERAPTVCGQERTEQLAESARVATLGRLDQIERTIDDRALAAEVWSEARAYRSRVQALLDAQRPHEAAWLALEFEGWAKAATRPTFVQAMQKAAVSDRRFRRQARKVAESLGATAP